MGSVTFEAAGLVTQIHPQACLWLVVDRVVAMPEFYNGAIDFKPGEEDDQRPKIDAACAPGCTSAWKNYLKCGDRIEAKGSGDCSSWYMDYHQCLDQCAVKSLFKVTN